MQIIFQNQHFIVVDKPCGVHTIPARNADKNNPTDLIHAFSKSLKIKLFPVHRLDFEVSGILLIAKNAEAHKQASLWFENRTIQKTYEALTELNPEKKIQNGDAFEWVHKLHRGKKRVFIADHGKESITFAKYINKIKFKNQDAMLWHLQPKTGRSHQLRFHLSNFGFPILGDALYGAKNSSLLAKNTIALRAIGLSFKDSPNYNNYDLPEVISTYGIEEWIMK